MKIQIILGLILSSGAAKAAPAAEETWRQYVSAARNFTQQGRFAEGYDAAHHGVRGAEASGTSDPRIGVALVELATAAQFLGRFAQAEAAYLRGLRVLDGTTEERPALIELLHGLGALYLEFGERDAAAEKVLRRAISLAEATLGATHPDLGAMLNTLASACLLQRHHDDARILFERARQILEPHLASHRANLAHAVMNLALLEFRRGDPVRGESLLRSAATMTGGGSSAALVKPLLNLGRAYLEVKRPKEAEQFTARAVAMAESTLGADHPLLAEALESHAVALRKSGRKSDARAVADRARAIAALTSQPHSVDIVDLRKR